MAVRTAATSERRAPLSRERIVAAAVELADREGIEAVSMRRLGQGLGVEAMSLYNHVGGKEDLLDGMVDRVVADIDPPAAAGDWQSVARARILRARQVMLRHRWAAAVIATRPQPGPAMMQYFDSMAGILRGGGFSVDLMHHGFHALGSRALGFSQELFDDSGGMAAPPEMQAAMVQQMVAAFPHLGEMVRLVTHDDASVIGAGCDDQWEFEFALDLILDGLERLRQREADIGRS